jgi:hypothetical protein
MIITELVSALSDGDLIVDWGNKRLDTLQRKTYGRILTSFGWVGTAGAAGDGGLELFSELNSIYKSWNPAADSIINRDRIVGLDSYVPSKQKFEIECIDDMSNTAVLHASFMEQRRGESLVGKIMGKETLLFENLGTMSLGVARGIESSKELSLHEVNESNDRFITEIGLLGGSALLDSGIEILVDGDFRGSLYNTVSTTKALQRNSLVPANIYIPKGSSLDIACIDAFPADCWLAMKICDLTETSQLKAAAVEAAKPDAI